MAGYKPQNLEVLDIYFGVRYDKVEIDLDLNGAIIDSGLSSSVDWIDPYDLVAHCILIAFEWDVLVTAKEKYPDIQTDFLTINSNYIRSTLKNQPDADPYLLYGEFEPRKHDKDFAKAIAAAGGDWWGPQITDVTPADVEYAQSLGIKVNLWNVESTQQGIEHAISFNADALTISDATMLQRQMRLCN